MTMMIAKTVVAPKVESTRSCVGDALRDLIANSRLKRLVDEERYDEWVDALSADIAAARKFLAHLIHDVRAITGVRAVASVDLELPSVGRSFDSNKWRVNRLAIEYRDVVTREVGRILNFRPNTNEKSPFLIPISKVEFDHDCVTFGHVSRDRRRLYSITFANARVKPIDDFTRSIPGFVARRVDRLKTTHFDWRPAVLDGVLVSEKLTAVSRNEFAAVTRAIDHAIDFDPALVISPANVGGKPIYFAIDFWKEGKNAMSPLQRWLDRYGQMSVSLLMVLIGLSLFWIECKLSAWKPLDPSSFLASTVVPLVMLFMVLAGIVLVGWGAVRMIVDADYEYSKYPLGVGSSLVIDNN